MQLHCFCDSVVVTRPRATWDADVQNNNTLVRVILFCFVFFTLHCGLLLLMDSLQFCVDVFRLLSSLRHLLTTPCNLEQICLYVPAYDAQFALILFSRGLVIVNYWPLEGLYCGEIMLVKGLSFTVYQNS